MPCVSFYGTLDESKSDDRFSYPGMKELADLCL